MKGVSARLCMLSALVMLFGCSTIPGGVRVTKSDFDNSYQVASQPGWVGGSGYVKLGLLWNDKMPKKEIRMDVMVADSGQIAQGESLHFNIDGSIVNLSSYDEKSVVTVEPPVVTQFYVSNGAVWVSKSYLVTLDLIKKISVADRVAWKLDLEKDYRDGVLESGTTTALYGFRQFISAYAETSKLDN